jgi:hypothetical protein
LWLRERAQQRATLIQGCLFGSFSALSTILALQLDANYHLNAQFAALSGCRRPVRADCQEDR